MKLDWSDIHLFLAVARGGTLVEAARQVGLTQPTMGRRIRALEQQVGQVLFQRTSEGLRLTDEGLAVLNYAERMEQEALAFERQLAGQPQDMHGSLRLSSSDWFGVHVLAPVLASFSCAHPGIRLELITDARRYNLARREADLVFRITPFTEPDIAQRQLLHLHYGLYGLAGTRLTDDGSGMRLIAMDDAFASLPDMVWLRQRFPQAQWVLGSNNREVQAQLCAAGAGLAVLPCRLAQAWPQLQRLDQHDSPPGRDVWLGYHQDLRRLSRLRALLDHLLLHLSDG
ncbi:LysR family transcriptional regulator [Pokkaliibacter plantistimulans]|uniref:LysR family transcriptional regulator n=1 Tax=Proteobacteria bacterium 228 TaxID=2083153 RepID=A0A2S5KPQ6_9PROT|nr:LysR family transcriptional regulator [Pokkaliibacter plantistimulans]PPC76615.1 LysR family transcriptional regulator [Pokkaliibacter plantistimulans]